MSVHPHICILVSRCILYICTSVSSVWMDGLYEGREDIYEGNKKKGLHEGWPDYEGRNDSMKEGVLI